MQHEAAPGDRCRPTATPIYQTAIFEQGHADRFGDYDYSRSGNPTRKVLEDLVAKLEGGTHGFAFSSGMAAITAVARTLRAGDEILADSDLYGGTCRLFARVLERSRATRRLSQSFLPPTRGWSVFSTPAWRGTWAASHSRARPEAQDPC